MTNSTSDLKITKFEVHAVYGAHFKVVPGHDEWHQWWKNLRQNCRHAELRREGWTPVYRDIGNTVTLALPAGSESTGRLTVSYPQGWALAGHDGLRSFDMDYSHMLTVREDGTAALTVRLDAGRRVGHYCVADVLAALLLAPRTIRGIRLNGLPSDGSSELATASPSLLQSEEDSTKSESLRRLAGLATQEMSPLCRLYLRGLRAFVSQHPGLNWQEYDIEEADELGETQVLKPWPGDPQIPYFVVMVVVEKEFYSSVFSEQEDGDPKARLENRRKLTKQLGAILGRWLTPRNVTYVSDDYLVARGLLRDGGFVNKYMNSLSFVTYGATAAICLHPDESDPSNTIADSALSPQEATYGSILRCVELSRLRWHHAITLSRKLDALIKNVVGQESAIDFATHLERLAELRSDAAIHFLDPMAYQWDATVGSELAEFLQTGVIESLESECTRKLEMVKQLVQDRLDVLQARDIEKLARIARRRRTGSGDRDS